MVATVSSERLGGGGTETGNPMQEKLLGDCLGRDVRDGNRLRPAGESINHDENLLGIVENAKWADNIDVNMSKAGTWRGEGGQPGDSVALNPRFLARDAIPTPLGDVSLHTWLDVAIGDQATCATNARVGKTMQGVKSVTTKFSR